MLFYYSMQGLVWTSPTKIACEGGTNKNRRTQKSHATAVFPVIFDDSVDSPGVGELGDGELQGEGVLGKAEIRAALLSMSGYGKPEYPDSKGELGAPAEERPSIRGL